MAHRAKPDGKRIGYELVLRYRPDIDGLRAVAVIAVVAFHAKLPWLGGGFAGVDVFFVISGYLITALLLSEYREAGRINLLNFWTRRARRLAPAFLFMMVSILVSAPFTLERISGETGSLARAAIASLLINANHFFLVSGDYFSASAETNPLLHIWSLSVEEQFYLVWPLALVATWSWAPRSSRTICAVMAGIFALSFAAACLLTAKDARQAFFLMPTRAWELVAGGMLALLLSKAKNQRQAVGSIVGAVALIILLGTFVFLTGRNGFPGPMAVIPVTVALLIIISGHLNPTSIASQCLTMPWIVYVGRISYPLYLWHWPVLVIFRSNRLYEPSVALDVLAVCIAVTLAMFTYEVVEKKSWRFIDSRKLVFGIRAPIGLASMGVLGALAIAVALGAWVRFGWWQSTEEQRLDLARRDMPPLECMFQVPPSDASMKACLGDTTKPTVLLWGDSHANHWRPAIEAVVHDLGANVATLTMNGCKPLPGRGGTPECAEFNKKVMNLISARRGEFKIAGVIVSARWPEGTGNQSPSISDADAWKRGQYYDGVSNTKSEALIEFKAELVSLADDMQDSGMRVLVVGPGPVQRFAAVHCLALQSDEMCGISMNETLSYVSPSMKAIEDVVADAPGIRVIYPLSFMCHEDRCPVKSGETIMFTDDDHITATFARKASQEFKPAVSWLLLRDDQERLEME